MEGQGVHGLPVVRDRRRGRAGERPGGRCRGDEAAPPVAVRHGREAAHEIPEVVRQIDVVALLEPFPGEVAVLTERDLAGQIQAQRVGAEPVRRLERIDGRPERLAHLLPLPVHPSMPEHLPRQRHSRAHQHRRPDDAVEPRDVLAHDVQVGRPPFLEQRLVRPVADGGCVVDEGVRPDVDDATRVGGQRDAPRLPGAAHRDVVEAALEKPQDLVAADLRLEEMRVGCVVIEQRLAVSGQAEEVVLLLEPLRRALVNRTIACDQILLRLERLARDAVPALVVALVEVAGLRDPARPAP